MTADTVCGFFDGPLKKVSSNPRSWLIVLTSNVI